LGKQRHGKPDKFDREAVPIEDRKATDDAAASAVRRFVTLFVNEPKRERVLTMLLHRDRNRRCEAIQTVYKWIEPSLQTELEGNAGFPQHLRDRFAALHGIIIDETSARHSTIAAAAVLAAGGFGAIFMADELPIALLFSEDGHPTLCSKR